jgi:uroporphyrinogen decarboxylase
MNLRDNVHETLRSNRTRQVPAALLSSGVWTFNHVGLTLQDVIGDAPRMAEVIEQTAEETGSAIVWVGSGFHNLAVSALGGAITYRPKGSPNVNAPLLEETADIRRIDLDRIEADASINSLWEATRLLAGPIGSRIMVGASQWGPFTLAGLYYGVERLMRSIYRDRAAAEAVLEWSTEITYRYLAPFIRAGAEILSVAEPSSSGDLISRTHFEQFAVPYLTKVISRLKADGAMICLHICGNITNRLDLAAATGADLISFDYKVPISKAAETFGSRVTFSGNLNPVEIMQRATPRQVYDASLQCLRQAGPASRYILMPGCDIPFSVPLANVQAMMAAANEWPGGRFES